LKSEYKMKRRWFPVITLLFMAPVRVFGGNPSPLLEVVPWNGHQAATSLTFDGGYPSQLDMAIPELNRRKMQGTFFLAANRIERKDDWHKILSMGHEIGNHTLDAKHVRELTEGTEEAQVAGAQHVLQKEFGIPIYSFSYPYSEITPNLENWVEKTHLLARGGEGKIQPPGHPDWVNIPSRETRTDYPFSTYRQWINDDLKKGRWLVWLIHDVDPKDRGDEAISEKVFGEILDYLQTKDIWVGTFLEVGSYFRAETIFEAESVFTQKEGLWSWKVPNAFPPNVTLKLKLGNSIHAPHQAIEIWQDSQKISPDIKGFYPVNFNLGRLTLRFLPKG
jgi:peptidoglycan-N-acetylglucosamine deacetylase